MPRHPGMDRRDPEYMEVFMWVAFKIGFYLLCDLPSMATGSRPTLASLSLPG